MIPFRSTETTELLPRSSTMKAPQAIRSNWKKHLAFKFPARSAKRSAEFNALIDKVRNDPQAVLTENEVNDFVLELMSHGEVDLLCDLLAQERLQTLHLARNVEEGAWQTLLKAMPDPCTVSQLILSGHKFTDRTGVSSLFELMRRMPELTILYFHSCDVELSMQFELPCFPLLKLQKLHVEKTRNPYALLRPILEVSQLTSFHFEDSNPGMDDETHLFFALTLYNQLNTVQDLTLRNLQGSKNLNPYVSVIQQARKLARLDLSLNDLSPLDCEYLLKALKEKPTLTSLSFAGCWRRTADKSDWKNLAMLVKLPSLVSLDLSRNKFPSSMAPVLMAIPGHPSLQDLNLRGFTTTNELITIALPAILDNTMLVSLQLPALEDGDFAPMEEAMKRNHWLRFLSIPKLEQWCSTMSAEESHRLYPNYLALMEHVARNQRAWEEKRLALMEGAMKVVLGSMGRIDPGAVFQNVARYAAGHVAARGNGDEAMALTLLDKNAHEEGLAALKRLQEEK